MAQNPDPPAAAVVAVDVPVRRLNAAETTFIVIGAIIGVGIFFNPTQVARLAGSAELALIAWALGGAIAICGALTFASLGSVYHGVGAQYEILRDAYGPMSGFLFVFCNATAVQAGAIAIIALVCTDNLSLATAGYQIAEWKKQWLAAGLIVGLMAANIVGVRGSAGIQAATVIIKIGLLLVIAALALLGPPDAGPATHETATLATSRTTPSTTPSTTSTTSTRSTTPTTPISTPSTLPVVTRPSPPAPDSAADPLALVLFSAVVPVLFAVGGWQHALWISGEVARPRRNLPLGILLGTGIVVAVYLIANWAYFRLLGYDGVAGSTALAAEAVATVWPAWGSRVVAGCVAVSAFGVLNAQLLSGPRLIQRLALDGRFFDVFKHLLPGRGTPAAAILMLGLLALMLLFAAGRDAVDRLTTGVVLVDALFFTLSGAAAFVLYRKRLRKDGSWLRLGWPIAPALFVLGEIGLIVGACRSEATREAAIIGAIWVAAAGVLYFAVFRRRTPSRGARLQ